MVAVMTFAQMHSKLLAKHTFDSCLEFSLLYHSRSTTDFSRVVVTTRSKEAISADSVESAVFLVHVLAHTWKHWGESLGICMACP